MSGCSSAPGSGTAAPLAIPPAPGVTVTNNCGNSVLTATGYTGTLLWSTSETTPSITVTIPGDYTVTQTVNGCSSTPGSGTATPIAPPPSPDVTVTNNCGNSVLTATGYTGTLLWSTGETTPSITATIPGDYTVTQTLNGCSSAPGSGTAVPLALPPVPVITQIGESLESSPAEFYQWFIDLSPIPEANGQTYTPIINGSYTVEVTDGNGCSQTSSAFLVLWVSTAEFEISNAIHLFPNPSAEFYTVTSPQYMTFNQIDVFDATGRLIESCVLPDLTSKQQFDSTCLSIGTYIISVHTSMGMMFKKLTIFR